MDFTQNREGFSQDDEMMMMMMSSNKGKQPFSYSSLSSSPSSCSSYHQMSLGPMSSWLGSNSHNNNTTSGFEFMEATTASPDQSDDTNNNNNNSSAVVGTSCVPSFGTIEKEHMFDKVVTPSDVGKLNRLVIPKQHAEKYFPLDASTNEKGLLLNFEDRNGKPWRFRYSYWNSSQSYVMTKGWSRFVKDKKLGAGDIVSFQRGVGELGKDMLYIDWRRRPDVTPHQHHHHHHPTSLPIFGMPQSHQYPIHRSIPWSPLLLRPPGPAMPTAALPGSHFHSVNNVNLYPYGRNSSSGYSGARSTNQYSQGNNVLYMRPAFPALQWQQQHQQQQGGGTGDGGAVEPMVFDSVPVVQGKAAAKRLRLFGVNMDCPISDNQDDDVDDEVLLSNTIQHATISSQAPHEHSAYSNSSLQLRLYCGTPVQSNFQDKGKAPSSSLDLDM